MSLWYRCVLQVILLENYSECLLPGGENDQNDVAQLNNLQVGRKLIKEKNSLKPSFCDYVRKALGKLALDNQKVRVTFFSAVYFDVNCCVVLFWS